MRGENLTEKQRNLLSKYISKDRIEKLSRMNFERTSRFIEMIVHFRSFNPVVGELCNIPYLKRKPTKDEKNEIELYINSNKDKFNLLEDEYVSLYEVNFLPNGKKWFVVRQTWFKGMSESPRHRYAKISEDGNNMFEGIYNLLFDSGIYSTYGLVMLYADSSQEIIDKK